MTSHYTISHYTGTKESREMNDSKRESSDDYSKLARTVQLDITYTVVVHSRHEQQRPQKLIHR